MSWRLRQGDALAVLATMREASVQLSKVETKRKGANTPERAAEAGGDVQLGLGV